MKLIFDKTNKVRMILAILVCFSVSAFAQPGYEITSFKIKTMEEANFTAALDEWMNSAAAKKYKGRIYLQRHENDGNNSATHSIVAVYPSLAYSEEYGDWIGSNESALTDWMAMIAIMDPISKITFTGRFVRLAGWGKIDDKDRIWLQHTFTTRDAASMYQALDAWMKSDTGKKFPGQLHLSRVLAAGNNAGNHVVAIGFESMAEMEQWNTMIGGSAGLSQILHTFSVINEYHGASLMVDVNAWGKSLKSVLK